MEQLRVRAVGQIEQGAHPEDVAALLRMTRAAVYGWLAKYREGGLEALKARPIPGRPLSLCFLPGYEPELNPDEWVWKHVKHDRLGRSGVAGPEDLNAKALAALHRLQKLPEVVRGFFRDPNPHYITA